MSDLLITGTDTGVGKTVVAAAIVLARNAAGVRTLGFKPVESGVSEGLSDSDVLARVSPAREPLAVPLLRLDEPLAPAVASDRAGRHFDPAECRRHVTALRALGYRVVVEGAGGVRVPLAWGYDAVDLALENGLDAIVVARAGLGTLNHVLLTVEALRSRAVSVVGIILNAGSASPDLAEKTNPAALVRLIPGVEIVAVPRHVSDEPLAAAHESRRFIEPLLARIDALHARG